VVVGDAIRNGKRGLRENVAAIQGSFQSMNGNTSKSIAVAKGPEEGDRAAIGWQERRMDIESGQARKGKKSVRDTLGKAGHAKYIWLISGQSRDSLRVREVLCLPDRHVVRVGKLQQRRACREQRELCAPGERGFAALNGRSNFLSQGRCGQDQSTDIELLL